MPCSTPSGSPSQATSNAEAVRSKNSICNVPVTHRSRGRFGSREPGRSLEAVDGRRTHVKASDRQKERNEGAVIGDKRTHSARQHQMLATRTEFSAETSAAISTSGLSVKFVENGCGQLAHEAARRFATKGEREINVRACIKTPTGTRHGSPWTIENPGGRSRKLSAGTNLLSPLTVRLSATRIGAVGPIRPTVTAPSCTHEFQRNTDARHIWRGMPH